MLGQKHGMWLKNAYKKYNTIQCVSFTFRNGNPCVHDFLPRKLNRKEKN